MVAWRRAVIVAALLLAGCSGGPDRPRVDLLDGWPAMAAPVRTTPAVGGCATSTPVSWFDGTDPEVTVVACAAPHTLEVVDAGTFTGAAAARRFPPPPDSTFARDAFAACSRAASAYVGGDWHHAWLGLHLSIPSSARWAAGARGYRCSVYELAAEVGRSVSRRGSLRGLFARPGPALLTCAVMGGERDVDGWWGSVRAPTPKPCTQSHNAEYTGSLTLSDADYPGTAPVFDLLQQGCYNKAAAYLGLTPKQFDARGGLGSTTWGISETQWALGDRVGHCYLVLAPDVTVHTSLKALGTARLPV
jgi:hypothetical protein